MGIILIKKVIANKMDINTNLCQVKIDAITGQLNIGTTYEGDFSKIIEEKIKQKLGKEALKK